MVTAPIETYVIGHAITCTDFAGIDLDPLIDLTNTFLRKLSGVRLYFVCLLLSVVSYVSTECAQHTILNYHTNIFFGSWY